MVVRFGKFLETVEPGLHFKLPFGIDAVTVLPTRRQLKLEFGFSTPEAEPESGARKKTRKNPWSPVT